MSNAHRAVAEAVYRMSLNQAVRRVWGSLRSLQELERSGPPVLTKVDLDLWEAVTIHPGVQEVLAHGEKRGDG